MTSVHRLFPALLALVACASGQATGGGDDGDGAGGSDGAGSAGSATAGAAGQAAAGSATAGNGSSGSSTAGSGTSGSGTAGSSTAGSATAGSGTAGSGTSGSATAGSGTAGSGTSGSATAGSGTAGSGTAGSGTSACDAQLAKLTIDFESTMPAFTHAVLDGASAAGWPLDEWERGTPSGAGPGACHGGITCWGTRLDGNITACERAELRSPNVDVSACAADDIVVEVFHWFEFVEYMAGGVSYADGGVVELSGDGGTTWTPGGAGNGTIGINGGLQGNDCVKPNAFYVDGKQGFVGKSAGWEKLVVPIPAALRTTKLRMRFAYGTGVNYPSSSATENAKHKAPGWYIDDVRVTRP